MLTTTTVFAKSGAVRGDWYLVDATGKTLGRLSTQIAHRLKGKHKADYTPARGHGRPYRRDQRREGPRSPAASSRTRSTTAIPATSAISSRSPWTSCCKEHPERAIETAVKGMLPKNPLGRAMFKKLKVYAGGEHPHSAQQPKPLEIQEA